MSHSDELGEGNELAEELQQFREKVEAAKMPKLLKKRRCGN